MEDQRRWLSGFSQLRHNAATDGRQIFDHFVNHSIDQRVVLDGNDSPPITATLQIDSYLLIVNVGSSSCFVTGSRDLHEIRHRQGDNEERLFVCP